MKIYFSSLSQLHVFIINKGEQIEKNYTNAYLTWEWFFRNDCFVRRGKQARGICYTQAEENVQCTDMLREST